jgi:predicted phosphoribosyltransferase
MAAFSDRTQAGRVLAGLLRDYAGRPDLLVLALPRGGVPVGYEIAAALGAPLDVLVVRKLGLPGHEELAMGAIAGAGGGTVVVNDEVVRRSGVPAAVLEEQARVERAELVRRERLWRGECPAAEVAGRLVILVDDGLATGSTMRAALAALRQLGPASVVVAVPTAPLSACQRLSFEADLVVCPSNPVPFVAVGHSYQVFDQTSDDQVRDLLARAAELQSGTS